MWEKKEGGDRVIPHRKRKKAHSTDKNQGRRVNKRTSKEMNVGIEAYDCDHSRIQCPPGVVKVRKSLWEKPSEKHEGDEERFPSS